MSPAEPGDGVIDISTPIPGSIPTWPGSPGAELTPLLSIAGGDVANASRLDMDVHTGTHVDAQRHFIDGGATIDELALEATIGPATVADVSGERAIGPETLEALGLAEDVERLLLRTRNSDEGLYAREFTEEYAALSEDGARWVADRGLRLIGIDYLSIQRFADGPETHRVLLAAGVAILEGIDLAAVSPGEYELLCLPLRLAGAEAAPARAVLRPRAAAAS